MMKKVAHVFIINLISNPLLTFQMTGLLFLNHSQGWSVVMVDVARWSAFCPSPSQGVLKDELRQKFCYPGGFGRRGGRIRCARSRVTVAGIDQTMSQSTRAEVLEERRRRYEHAGLVHKRKLLDQAQQLLGYHRKSAIRVLGKPAAVRGPCLVTGRPRSLSRARAGAVRLRGGIAWHGAQPKKMPAGGLLQGGIRCAGSASAATHGAGTTNLVVPCLLSTCSLRQSRNARSGSGGLISSRGRFFGRQRPPLLLLDRVKRVVPSRPWHPKAAAARSRLERDREPCRFSRPTPNPPSSPSSADRP